MGTTTQSVQFTEMSQSQVPDSPKEKGDTDVEQGTQLDEFEDNSQVPKLSYLALFWKFFYRFGCFAWGGTVAQIALIKEELVVKEKWITISRFQRVFAVYQIVPGPKPLNCACTLGVSRVGELEGSWQGWGSCYQDFY